MDAPALQHAVYNNTLYFVSSRYCIIYCIVFIIYFCCYALRKTNATCNSVSAVATAQSTSTVVLHADSSIATAWFLSMCLT